MEKIYASVCKYISYVMRNLQIHVWIYSVVMVHEIYRYKVKVVKIRRTLLWKPFIEKERITNSLEECKE